ncbi:4-(cytidine 5'-diphospho)-2-C-methyl-D-erythritol kinase [Hoeflea sp. TYP-13]|uniref:4-(cytidine 5'-diphospho)-2-C-methyl-D-erythritol kinase n=1 Tax=Hoeflea sp. TYP-13 TaxID=3230023 RepID=UPI0034C65395
MVEIVETAWAKINLALHVTGQREDGYHLIDSLVTFADIGDVLSFETSNSDKLTVSGAFAELLSADTDNLVVRARDLFRQAAIERGHSVAPVSIHLEKNLPIASGIGGGSADAAACMRGLARLWNIPDRNLDIGGIAAGLGADVPMCHVSEPLIARGIGEDIEPVKWLAPFSIVLVNPLETVSTPRVFGALGNKNNDPLNIQPANGDLNELVLALQNTRNDLEEPAKRLAPVIGEVMAALAECQPLFQRMSGSGATCFGIFHDPVAARLAGDALRDKYPHWWVRSGMTRTAS